MMKKRSLFEKTTPLLAAALLVFFFWRIWHTANVQSNTFDEAIHMFNGVMYWQRGDLFSITQNPPLVDALVGLAVRVVLHPALPFDTAVWQSLNWWDISHAFLWEIGNDGLVLMAVGRFVITMLAMLLGALVYRWSGQLFHSRAAGLLTLLLFTFDPNILAHSALTTTDLGIAFFLTLAAYLVWRYWSGRGGTAVYLLAGVSIGLAFSAKFSATILVPAIGIILVYRGLTERASGRQWLRMGLEAAGWLLLALFVLSLCYHFQLDLLMSEYTWQRQHHLEGHPSFLLGEISTTGWWYYIPLAFAIKTPVAVLLLLVIALGLLVVRRQFGWQIVWPLLLAAGVFGGVLVLLVNIGFRYILPMLPFLYVVLGQLAVSGYLKRPLLKTAVAVTVVMAVLASLFAHPYYLAYFNQLAGGSENGWKILADSNVDWGQDIQRLGQYMSEHGIESVNIAAFGQRDLSAYSVTGQDLAQWAAADVAADEFYPAQPAPGTYAISVTELHGVYADDPERYAWFLNREPAAKIGHALFVYEVEPAGEPVSVALSGLGVGQIAPEDFAAVFGSNDVRISHFDARTSLLWPVGETDVVWTAVSASTHPQHPALADLSTLATDSIITQTVEGRADSAAVQLQRWPQSPLSQLLQSDANGRLQSEYRWSAEPTVSSLAWDAQDVLAGTAVFAETLTLLAYEPLEEQMPSPGQPLFLMSYWHVNQTPAGQLKIFLHLIDEQGQVAAQFDGLDVETRRLRRGNEIAQLHTIWLPPELPPGQYGLQLGVYDSETGLRFSVPTGDQQTTDRLLLNSITVGK